MPVTSPLRSRWVTSCASALCCRSGAGALCSRYGRLFPDVAGLYACSGAFVRVFPASGPWLFLSRRLFPSLSGLSHRGFLHLPTPRPKVPHFQRRLFIRWSWLGARGRSGGMLRGRWVGPVRPGTVAGLGVGVLFTRKDDWPDVRYTPEVATRTAPRWHAG